MARNKQLSVAVYEMKKDGVVMDFRDKVAVFSLLLHLWNKYRYFYLVCKMDENGRIISLDDSFFGGGNAVLFHMRDPDSGMDFAEQDMCRWELNGYEDLRMGELETRRPIELPFLRRIGFHRQTETFDEIVPWLNGKNLPKLEEIGFFQDCGPDSFECKHVAPSLRNLSPLLAAQIKSLVCYYESNLSGNELAALWVGILTKFSKLKTLRLPWMSAETFVIVLDRICEAGIFLNVEYMDVNEFYQNPSMKRAMKRAVKKFMSTFHTVKYVCGGYSRKELKNKSNNSARESRKRPRQTLPPPVAIIAEGNTAVDDLTEFSTPMPPLVASFE